MNVSLYKRLFSCQFRNGKPIFDALQKRRTGISVTSSKYNFKGINTETTISEVLKKHPNSKIYIDLISGWEFIYLKDAKIKLNFKTDSTNRIGIYDFDPETAANGIKRKDAKIDLIQTF